MKITLEDSTKLRMTFWVSDYVFNEGLDVEVGDKVYEKTDEKLQMKGEPPTVIWREKEN